MKQDVLPGMRDPLLDRAMLEERVKAKGPPSPAAGRGTTLHNVLAHLA